MSSQTPEIDEAFLKEARIGLMVVTLLLSVLVYVAYGKLSGRYRVTPIAFQPPQIASSGENGKEIPDADDSFPAASIPAANITGSNFQAANSGSEVKPVEPKQSARIASSVELPPARPVHYEVANSSDFLAQPKLPDQPVDASSRSQPTSQSSGQFNNGFQPGSPNPAGLEPKQPAGPIRFPSATSSFTPNSRFAKETGADESFLGNKFRPTARTPQGDSVDKGDEKSSDQRSPGDSSQSVFLPMSVKQELPEPKQESVKPGENELKVIGSGDRGAEEQNSSSNRLESIGGDFRNTLRSEKPAASTASSPFSSAANTAAPKIFDGGKKQTRATPASFSEASPIRSIPAKFDAGSRKRPISNQPSLPDFASQLSPIRTDSLPVGNDAEPTDESNTPSLNQTEEPAEKPNQVTTTAGDSFWLVAQQIYGDGRYFNALYNLNRDRVASFNELTAGTVLLTPPANVLQKRWPRLCPRPEVITRGGQTLFEIAGEHCGQASRYVEILKLNYMRLPKDVDPETPLPAGVLLELPRPR